MATSTSNICIGPATVSVGAWVTAGGAGTLTDVGHTSGPTAHQVTYEHYDMKSERVPGTIRKIVTAVAHKLKIPMEEATMELFLLAMKQPAANKTGTTPNFTVLVGDPSEDYKQVRIVSKGVGTTLTRTITIWRAIVESVAEIQYTKGEVQKYEVTLDCLYDESVATGDKFLKVVDS